jgi:hemolysin activation/secretion protein
MAASTSDVSIEAGQGTRGRALKAAPLHRWRRCIAIAGALLFASPGPAAWALSEQAVSPAPTIDRDRIDRQEPVIPRPPRSAPPPAPRAPDVVEQAGQREVTLARLRYDGASLPRERLDRATAAYIGQPLTRDTLQKIANAISGVYAASDVSFHAVTVPRQTLVGGELLIQVTEGRIAGYALRKETRSTPTALIAAQIDRLMRDRPTHRGQLERTLSLLRDIPGQTVDAQLRTTAKPDELFLDLDVKRKQVDVTLDLNNNGVTNVVSGVQAQLSVGVHGVLREGDSTRFSAYLPLYPDRYQFYAASHTTPIGANGTTLGFSGAYVRTRTEGTDIRGQATQAGIALSHPLIRSYRRNLSLGVSLDGINSDNYFLDTAFGGFRTRVVRASATWSSVGKKSGYALAGSVSRGLDALGARPFVGYSQASFTKANLQLTAVSEIGKSAAIKVTGRGQYANDRLPTTERFSLGGEGAGLAFRLGELTAERALAGSVELSRNVVGGTAGRGGLTVFAYADGAVAHSLARPSYAIPKRDYALASAGGGIRVAYRQWTVTAQVAIPVKSVREISDRKARFLFSIGRAV